MDTGSGGVAILSIERTRVRIILLPFRKLGNFIHPTLPQLHK